MMTLQRQNSQHHNNAPPEFRFNITPAQDDNESAEFRENSPSGDDRRNSGSNMGSKRDSLPGGRGSMFSEMFQGLAQTHNNGSFKLPRF